MAENSKIIPALTCSVLYDRFLTSANEDRTGTTKHDDLIKNSNCQATKKKGGGIVIAYVTPKATHHYHTYLQQLCIDEIDKKYFNHTKEINVLNPLLSTCDIHMRVVRLTTSSTNPQHYSKR